MAYICEIQKIALYACFIKAQIMQTTSKPWKYYEMRMLFFPVFPPRVVFGRELCLHFSKEISEQMRHYMGHRRRLMDLLSLKWLWDWRGSDLGGLSSCITQQLTLLAQIKAQKPSGKWPTGWRSGSWVRPVPQFPYIHMRGSGHSPRVFGRPTMHDVTLTI